MTSPLPPALQGLTRFWWDAADYLASAAQKRLGLWPVAAKPFLPRAELEPLAGLVGFLEAVLRRLFCLAALELGPLPPQTPAPIQPPRRAGAPVAAGAQTGRQPAAPRFRLRESARQASRTPPKPHFRTGPRIRFLDADTPVDLRDYPAQPTDILPAGKLVRRVLAINHALDHAAEYIDRMRRLMVTGTRPIRASVPPALRSRKLRHLQQESARQLHALTSDLLPPDTS